MQEVAAYKDEFLSEAKDQITKINTLLINLEREPGNLDYINEIFRFCHTLKGNSAALSYKRYSALAHSAENLLGKIRSKELKATPEVIDALFRAVDLLDAGIDLIRDDREHELSTDEMDRELANLSGDKDIVSEKQEVQTRFPLAAPAKAQIRKRLVEGLRCLRAVILFKKACNFKKAKSMIIKRDLERVGEVLAVNPKFDSMAEDSFNFFELIIAVTAGHEDSISSVLSGITETSKFFVIGWDEEMNPDLLQAEAPQVFARPSRSIRIDIKKLDHLLNLVGELIISNIRLRQISERAGNKELVELANSLDLIVREIQDEVMDERMLPLKQMFSKLPRVVRDLANQAGKNVNLIIEGEDIEIDRTVFEEIGDPMMHMLRNAIDHGIESAEERQKAGKNPAGTIRIIASRGRDSATIELIDDGRGIDPVKVREAAVRKGIISMQEAEKLSPQESQRLVFRQGVSTAEKVTSVSGRGVGMDVVQSKVSSYGGFVKLASKPGEGTSIRLHIPLTLAIIKALLVNVRDHVFAIPLTNVQKTFHIEQGAIRSIQMQEVIIHNKRQVPVLRLDDFFGIRGGPGPGRHIAVIVEKDERPVALLADSIFNEQEILIKSMGRVLKDVKGIAGATILGDGRICMILDVMSLF
ncbi:chemotaxis protein CheA [Candidatus Woesearchaeota archaeon]|nr:chemotaxis protein CheA [Candidatus Woesearchaeota archaeon]